MVRPPGASSGIRVPAIDGHETTSEATPLSTPLGPSTGLPSPTARHPGSGLFSVRQRADRRFTPLPHGVASATIGVPGAVPTQTARRVVLMGGGPEDDVAARSFALGAGGGDVVVLRASGSTTSYNDYFFTDVAADPPPCSVTTLRIDAHEEGGHAGVVERVDGAGAVWLAGGDQHRYLTWPDPLLEALAALSSGRTIGGTSAGAMSLGGLAFDAAEGSLRSRTALREPTDRALSIVRPRFAQPELSDHLVDTHFSEREREGRLIAFLARARIDHGVDAPRGVGIDEGTALVIDGDRFEVRGRGDVFVYALSGDVVVRDGEPLEARGIQRVRLSNGDSGAWPIERFDDELVVERGEVKRR